MKDEMTGSVTLWSTDRRPTPEAPSLSAGRSATPASPRLGGRHLRQIMGCAADRQKSALHARRAEDKPGRFVEARTDEAGQTQHLAAAQIEGDVSQRASGQPTNRNVDGHACIIPSR